MTEGRGERATGTSNTIYDLSSVLFHALKGGASYDLYIRDAEEAGDEELADFFRRVRDEDGMRADEAQLLLAERTPTATRTEGAVPGAPPGSEPPGVSSGTQPVAEEPPPGDTLGETASVGRTATEEDLARSGEVPESGEVRPGAQGTPPPRTEPISAPPGPRDVPPRRTEEVPMAEEVPSGLPPQAPPGDVQREILSEPPPRSGEASTVEEERARREESEEDKGLIDKARDYLRGE